MISISPFIKIYLHREPVDMRKSYDGLFGIVKNELAWMFVRWSIHVHQSTTQSRQLMYWDKDGDRNLQKRLERGYFSIRSKL